MQGLVLNINKYHASFCKQRDRNKNDAVQERWQSGRRELRGEIRAFLLTTEEVKVSLNIQNYWRLTEYQQMCHKPAQNQFSIAG